MQDDDNRDAGPATLPGSPSDSDHDDTSSGAFPPSAKLREKLNKLANQRLDLSSIKFVNGAPEFHGSYATVSRAFMVSPSGGQDRPDLFNRTKNKILGWLGPAGGTSRRGKVGAPLPFGPPAGPTLQDVAVKKMHISYDPARILGLALREAEFLVGLSHKNIIKLEGFVEDVSKKVVWLVFPWAENGNLKSFIASAEWEIPERICLIDDVARGIEYLHSQQPPIRHGDLKSINILVNSEYRAVITDFGSARRQTTEVPDGETSHAESNPPPALSLEPAFCGATNTMTLTLKGDHFTLRWAAPELLNKKKATLAIDIWALGCVIYEVMTNSIPFQDVEADTAVMIRVIMGDLPSITNDARMALIKALCSLALACWSQDPRKRPTAEDCRKSINWMPMIRPDPIRTADAAASRARSPALLMQLGHMYRRQGDYTNAMDLYTKALGSYRETGNSKGKAAALAQLAQVHRLRNENSQAVTLYSEALQICTDIDDRQGKAYILLSLADVHRVRDEYSQAITFYSSALQIRTDIGDRQGRADALSGLAKVHQARNKYSQAERFYTEALQIRTDIGDRGGRADTLSGLADVHRLRSEYSQAVTFYTEALQICTDVGDRHRKAIALSGLADVHRLRKEYSQAITFYSEALEAFTDIGSRQGRAKALQGLAGVHSARKEYSQALPFFSETLKICADIGDRYGRAIALRSLARVHQSQKEYSQAVTLFSEALEICTDIGDRAGRAHSLSGLGDVHRDQGNYGDAIGVYTEAAEIFGQIGEAHNAAYASNQAANASMRGEAA